MHPFQVDNNLFEVLLEVKLPHPENATEADQATELAEEILMLVAVSVKWIIDPVQTEILVDFDGNGLGECCSSRHDYGCLDDIRVHDEMA
jgi:hypothetical protein